VLASQASLASFIDDAAKREIAIARAEASLAVARQDYAQDRLSETTLSAPHKGLAIYSDPTDWAGRPVTTGETIIQIADPARVLLRIDAPLSSGETLRSGARLKVFLDSDPLNPIEATLTTASYYSRPRKVMTARRAGFSLILSAMPFICSRAKPCPWMIPKYLPAKKRPRGGPFTKSLFINICFFASRYFSPAPF